MEERLNANAGKKSFYNIQQQLRQKRCLQKSLPENAIPRFVNIIFLPWNTGFDCFLNNAGRWKSCSLALAQCARPVFLWSFQ